MVKEILVYPNKILREKSKDVTSFDPSLHMLLDDMYDTMVSREGIGLAAIQIGVALNVLLINLVDEEGVQKPENLFEIINPHIIEKDGATTYQEGCLSVPGFTEDIKRAQHIIVEYCDRNGVKQTMECEDFLAVAWQHEMEHLAGHLFIENLSILKRKKFEKEWKKMLKDKN